MNVGRRAVTYVDVMKEDTGLETTEELKTAMMERNGWRQRADLARARARPKYVSCAFGSFQKARITKNVISDISQLDGTDNLNDQEKSLLSEFIEKGNKSRTTPLPEINSRRKNYPMLKSS